ncbi:MAG: ArnT family glycosyltransferase [Bradymonadia bacterium]
MTTDNTSMSPTPSFDKNGRIAFGVLCLMFVGFGIAGVDFGRHWDEPKLLRSVDRAFDSGVFLPGWYQYPSLTFWIGLAVKYAHALVHDGLQINLSFPLMWRSVMVIVTCFTGLWTYLLSLHLSEKRGVALLATSIIFLSPELLYHARWIAPDTLMMQFGIASSLALYLSTRSLAAYRKKLWQACLLAGFACSAKYPGGLFIVPIVIVAMTRHAETLRWSVRLKHVSMGLLVFLLTLILLTPGMVIEARQFVQDVYSEIEHYRRGHSTYSVRPGLEHFWLNLRYLSLCLSPNQYIQFFGGVSTMFGIILCVRKGYLPVVSVLAVPIAYLVYFSSQRVMIVRNLLVLLPFVAIFCAMGIHECVERWANSRATWGIIFTMGLLNVIHAHHSVSSLLQPKPVHEAISQYISQHPNTHFLPSFAFKDSPVAPKNEEVTWDGHQEVKVLFWSDQKPKPLWLTNQPNRYTVVAGPSDVNWSYYPSWLGSRRLLAVSLEDARAMNIRVPFHTVPSSQSK